MSQRTAPEIAAGLTRRRSASSPAVSPSASAASTHAKTRAGIRGTPDSVSSRAKSSTKRRAASAAWSSRPSMAIILVLNFTNL